MSEGEARIRATKADLLERAERAEAALEKLEKQSSPYPREDGDMVVLGPEVFASKDGRAISWRGESFVRQASAKQLVDDASARNADLIAALEDRQAELERCEVQRDAAVEQLLLTSDALLTIGKLPRWADHRKRARQVLAELDARKMVGVTRPAA